MQAFMDDLTDRGVVQNLSIQPGGEDTAFILPFFLLHGIVHTCPYTRWVHHQRPRQVANWTQQNLYEEVNKAANSFPAATRTRYQTAAATFRIPFWDWAGNPPSGETFFPSAAASPNIDIVTPQSNGQKVPFRNPLYSFRFNPLNPHGNDFSNLRGTPVSLNV